MVRELQEALKPSGGAAHFAAYDGNGNVMALVDGSNGTISANYEFSPFGETIRASGVMAKSNCFRFSTKFTDDESDFLYYGYRYYNPSTGTWFSRDPLGEEAGASPYTFTGNSPLNGIDIFGLAEVAFACDAFIPWNWVQFPDPPGVSPRVHWQVRGDGRGPSPTQPPPGKSRTSA